MLVLNDPGRRCGGAAASLNHHANPNLKEFLYNACIYVVLIVIIVQNVSPYLPLPPLSPSLHTLLLLISPKNSAHPSQKLCTTHNIHLQ